MESEREAQENPQEKPTQNPPRTQWRIRKAPEPILPAGESNHPKKICISRKPRTQPKKSGEGRRTEQHDGGPPRRRREGAEGRKNGEWGGRSPRRAKSVRQTAGPSLAGDEEQCGARRSRRDKGRGGSPGRGAPKETLLWAQESTGKKNIRKNVSRAGQEQ